MREAILARDQPLYRLDGGAASRRRACRSLGPAEARAVPEEPNASPIEAVGIRKAQ